MGTIGAIGGMDSGLFQAEKPMPNDYAMITHIYQSVIIASESATTLRQSAAQRTSNRHQGI